MENCNFVIPKSVPKSKVQGEKNRSKANMDVLKIEVGSDAMECENI